jgi:uncharacterized membrane protein YjjP (DUF1212 family)
MATQPPASGSMPNHALPGASRTTPDGVSAATLTHAELVAVLDVTLRLGQLIATAGAAAFRVRETMRRTAGSFGVERAELSFHLDTLHATLVAGEHRVTEMLRLEHVGVDMNRIVRIALLSRELELNPGRRTPAELGHELDAIASAPSPYPDWITPWLLGAACGAFCGGIGGSAWQIVAAFLGTFAGQLLRLRQLRTHPQVTTLVVSCSFASALVSWGVARGLGAATTALALGVSTSALGPGKAVLASVLYLIPGVPLVNGLIDLLQFDLAAGLTRCAYATLIVVCIAVGMLTFLALTGFALS